MATTRAAAAAASSRALASPSSGRSAAADPLDDDDDARRVLREANALLEKIGFGARKFATFDDLVASVSSMSVALYEKLFQFRLAHIARVPKSLADYEANAQLVVDALSGALLDQHFDVRGVTGESLCAGDARSIEQVVRMFEQIFGILEEANSRGEQARFPTPPPPKSSSNASALSLSERENVRQTAALKPAKRLTKKKLKKRSAAHAAARGESDDADSSGDDDDGARRHRPSRLQRERLPGGLHMRHSQKGDANLYETSDASITRSRGGELSAARSRGISITAGAEQRTGRADRDGSRSKQAAARAAMSSISVRTGDAEHGGSGSAAIKKRSRRLNQSFESRPLQQQQQHQDSAERRKAARSKMPKKSAKSHQGDQDTNLLTTQKYGRFVPVARHPTGRSPASSDGGASDSDFGGGGGGLLEGGEQMYFGGVSSVSNGGSGSEKSVHFIEEDDEVSRNFSSGIDLQNLPPNVNANTNALLHSPSNAYDDDGGVDTRALPGKATSRGREAATTKKSTNQEEAESEHDGEEEKQAVELPESPQRQKASREHPKSAPELSTGSRVIKQKDPAASLYPLLPRGNAATSKSHTEFMRYKLYLKDHLQDLRQREYCQRQHLERAYKVGEHSANVEKIRARRFQQDVRLQRISIGLEAKNEEEKHLRHTLTHILQLEKEKLRDEHRTTSSILKQIQKDHAERENAMETFYANQIQLVKEQTHREVKERELVEKAHRLASEQMIREMRKEREHQITALLQEKQHLEEARRFRTASRLTSTLERGDEASARASQSRVDAFYTAAMKARQHNAPVSVAATGASKKRVKQAYRSVRPGASAPLTRRVK